MDKLNEVLILELNGAYLLFNVESNKHLPMNDLEDVASSTMVYDSQNNHVGDLSLFQWGNIPQATIERLEDESDNEINTYLELCLQAFKGSQVTA